MATTAKKKHKAAAAAAKFYAVKKGHNPGIYTTWKDCNKQVEGYKGNQYKGFNSRTEAEQYMGDVTASPSGATMLHVPAISESAHDGPKPLVVVKVKRSRRSKSISPTEAQPSSTLEALDSTGVHQEQIGPLFPYQLSMLVRDDQNAADVPLPSEEDVYQVEYDGASKSNPGPAGAGALVRRPDGSVVCELREGLGSTTNNVAEYRAFILGLRGALDRGIYRVRVQGDSKLVCEQVLGRWKVNQPMLNSLCKEAQKLIQNFSEFSIRHVDREFNSTADKLANEAVSLPETKFVSLFESTEAREGPGTGGATTMGGDPRWRQGRGSKTYGTLDFLRTSQLRLACNAYCLGYRPPSVAGAQWLRNTLSPFKGNPTILLVAKPRVSCRSWITTRRCFTSMAVRFVNGSCNITVDYPNAGTCFTGPTNPPAIYQTGFKDTAIVWPGNVTRYGIRFLTSNGSLFPFDPTVGPGYVWHCHILDHEDNDMMRPYKVIH